MKELVGHYKAFILVLILPYLFFLFFLTYPITYYVNAPGGLTEVKDLIEIDYNNDKETEGTISTTYIVSIKRPTYFQFMLGNFSPYTTINVLSGSSLTYTNSEIAKIDYLSKETSVNASIIVAYEKASEDNPEIVINYVMKILVYGKAEYLDHYDDIEFGDEFIQVVGDGGYIATTRAEVSAYTVDSDSYDFTFKNSEGETYVVTLTKDPDYHLFGLYMNDYYIVDDATTYPHYTEKDSNIGGPSGGLLQTISIYNMLIEEDLTHGLKIAGTGTIEYDGSVGYIGGVEQKVVTAYLNKVDLFFMPSLDPSKSTDNYQEALRVCEEYGIETDGWLIPVSSFDQAIDYLKGLD